MTSVTNVEGKPVRGATSKICSDLKTVNDGEVEIITISLPATSNSSSVIDQKTSSNPQNNTSSGMRPFLCNGEIEA